MPQIAANVTISGCTFSNNTGVLSGAINITSVAPLSSFRLVISSTTFSYNRATDSVAALVSLQAPAVTAHVSITQVDLLQNRALIDDDEPSFEAIVRVALSAPFRKPLIDVMSIFSRGENCAPVAVALSNGCSFAAVSFDSLQFALVNASDIVGVSGLVFEANSAHNNTIRITRSVVAGSQSRDGSAVNLRCVNSSQGNSFFVKDLTLFRNIVSAPLLFSGN